MNCTVFIDWDDEAGVYVATSDDVPGLVIEHQSSDMLMQRVLGLVPELFALNRPNAESPKTVRFIVKRDAPIPLAA